MPDKIDQDVSSTNDAECNLPKKNVASDAESKAENISKKVKLDEKETESHSGIGNVKLDSLSQEANSTEDTTIAGLPNSFKVCKPCGKAFTGPINYLLHMNSEKHRKVVCPPVKIPYECKPCDKQFTGPIPYTQHLKSKLHIITLKYIEQTEKSKVNTCTQESTNKLCTETNASNSQQTISQTSKEFSCEICDKRFTGPIPYEIHRESKIHKYNLMQLFRPFQLEEKAKASANENSIDCDEPQLVALKKIETTLLTSKENTIESEKFKDVE